MASVRFARSVGRDQLTATLYSIPNQNAYEASKHSVPVCVDRALGCCTRMHLVNIHVTHSSPASIFHFLICIHCPIATTPNLLYDLAALIVPLAPSLSFPYHDILSSSVILAHLSPASYEPDPIAVVSPAHCNHELRLSRAHPRQFLSFVSSGLPRRPSRSVGAVVGDTALRVGGAARGPDTSAIATTKDKKRGRLASDVMEWFQEYIDHHQCAYRSMAFYAVVG